MGEKEMKTPMYDEMFRDLFYSQNYSKDTVKSFMFSSIKQSRIFKIPKDLTSLFLLTKPTENYELPYETIFIEQFIKQGNNNINGILLSQKPQTLREFDHDNKILVYSSISLNGESFSTGFKLNDPERNLPSPSNEIEDANIRISEMAQANMINTINDLVNNFLCFVNSPDIEYVTKIDTPRDTKIRKRKGKPQRPPIASIILTDPIKRYLSKQRLGEKMVYSHRFWVRGHWRTLRNIKRYGENTGKNIWIKPYIKGDGLLINKNYELRT